jgi:hypothetical protein
MDLAALERLIALCQARGVREVEVQGIRLVLGAPPVQAQPEAPRAPVKPRSPVEQVEDLEARLLAGRRTTDEAVRSV